MNNKTKDPGGPLFHRIQSPTFDADPSAAKPDGLARLHGARGPQDYSSLAIVDFLTSTGIKAALEASLAAVPVVGPAILAINALLGKIDNRLDFLDQLSKLIAREGQGLLFARFLRSIPHWVPVGRKGSDPNHKEVEHEVEGSLDRSFMPCRDLPQLQWSRWYKWAFHVTPIPGYRHLIGLGNTRNEAENDLETDADAHSAIAERLYDGPTTISTALACVLDTGATFVAPGNQAGPKEGLLPGLMYHPRWPFWPQPGDHFWARGRFVYDCTHVVKDKSETRGDGERMPTQINPLKMLAVARREGFKFVENEFHVPATRFMFFASRRAGYVDFESIAGAPEQDPVFIVDLPPGGEVEPVTWRIQHTGEIPGNTLVVRPRLLMQVEHLPYGIPASVFPDKFKIVTVEPTIEPVKPEDPKQLPKQVRITIPLSKAPKDADACGCVVTLGWFDPDNRLARDVKKVKVEIARLSDINEGGDIRFRWYVNGRHRFADARGVGKALSLSSELPVEVLLPVDRDLLIGSHGLERNGFGEHMEKTDKERILRVGGLFDQGPGTKIIKDGVEFIKFANGTLIRSDFLKELLDEAGDIVTQPRRDVDWKKDVDQKPDDPESDAGKKADGTASAVAREMFFDPVALINRQDVPNLYMDPVGVANFGGVPSTAIRGAGLAAELNDGNAVREFVSFTKQPKVLGDAHTLFVVLKGDGEVGFRMHLKITTSHQHPSHAPPKGEKAAAEPKPVP